MQGLKPLQFCSCFGTTEVVPFHMDSSASRFWQSMNGSLDYSPSREVLMPPITEQNDGIKNCRLPGNPLHALRVLTHETEESWLLN